MFQSLREKFLAPPPAGQARPAAAPVAGIALIEQFVCGVDLAILQSATIASGFNAMRARRRFQRPLALRNFIPRRPSQMPSLARICDEMRLEDGVLDAIDAFLAGLPGIEADIDLICGAVESQGQALAVQRHAKQLDTAARRIHRLALGATAAIDAIASRSLPALYSANTQILKSLLTKIGEGGSPCIDARGNCFLPELPQRRPAPRRAVALPCIIEHLGQTAHALVRDISVSGAGLDRAPQAVPQNVIVIDVAGRCLAGVVVWQRGGSAGVKFNKPLRSDDPLLAV